MNYLKISVILVGTFMILGVAGFLHAGEGSSGKVDLKLLWSKEYGEDVGYFLTEHGRIIIFRDYEEDDQPVGEEVRFLDKKGNLIKSFVAKRKDEVEGPDWFTKLSLRGSSSDGRYFLFARDTKPIVDAPKRYSYYTEDGERLWDEVIAADNIILSPNGEYLGYSGALNEAEPSTMDWWEVRDKEFNLLWRYEPKYNFDAVLLDDGRTLMMEGYELKVYDRGGRLLDKVMIEDLEPYNLSYQMGSALPTSDIGPNYMVSTSDGRYTAFVCSQYDKETEDYFWTLYSVDMKTKRWWSYPLKTTQVDDVHITGDGRHVMVFRPMGLFFFDNRKGELVWKDTTGWDQWESSLLSDRFDVCERLSLVLVSWIVPGYEYKGKNNYKVVPIKEEEQKKIAKKSYYILDYGKRKYSLEKFGLDEPKQCTSRHSNLVMMGTEDKISLYEVIGK